MRIRTAVAAAGTRAPYSPAFGFGLQMYSNAIRRLPLARGTRSCVVRVVAIDTQTAAADGAVANTEAASSPAAAAAAAPSFGASVVERTVCDPSKTWASKRQVEPCGALLVRPDGHVTWRCERFDTGETQEAREEAAGRLLRVAVAAALGA